METHNILKKDALCVSKQIHAQSKQTKHQKNVGNMFKVNNKDTRKTSLMWFWCLYRCLWKQSSRGVLKKSCSGNMQQIYWRKPMLKCVISITFLSNFIEIAFRQGSSHVNLLYIFRTPFPKNTSG